AINYSEELAAASENQEVCFPIFAPPDLFVNINDEIYFTEEDLISLYTCLYLQAPWIIIFWLSNEQLRKLAGVDGF
uniref:hypothetical protein n=1 Tax=Acinetobacter baumannii TaxID=470 RepID=UPI001C07C668